MVTRLAPDARLCRVIVYIILYIDIINNIKLFHIANAIYHLKTCMLDARQSRVINVDPIHNN